MNIFEQTEIFAKWLRRLKDSRGRARIAARIRSAEHGNFGDHKPLGGGLFEMRIAFGPGYRVYYVQRGSTVYLLLAGGDKSSQRSDIEKARELAAELED